MTYEAFDPPAPGRRRFLLAVSVTLGGTAAWPARAETFPVRPLRLIVPFPAGGPTDIVARPLAQQLGDALGQQLIVDNRGGAFAWPVSLAAWMLRRPR